MPMNTPKSPACCLQLVLRRIHAHITEERDGDEFYCEVTVAHEGRGSLDERRHPGPTAYWPMARASFFDPEAILYEGPAWQGTEISLKFFDDDTPLSSDFLGACGLTILNPGAPELSGVLLWSTGKDAQDRGQTSPFERTFSLTGKNTSYTIHLTARRLRMVDRWDEVAG